MADTDPDFEMRPLRLEGRYLLPEKAEFGCHTLEVSPGKLHLAAVSTPYRGQRVVAYLQDAGRIEGVVSDVTRGEFWLKIEASDRKREQLTGVLTALLGGEAPASWHRHASAQPDPLRPRRNLSPAYVAAVAEALDMSCPISPAEQPEEKPKPAAAPLGSAVDPNRRYLDFI